MGVERRRVASNLGSDTGSENRREMGNGLSRDLPDRGRVGAGRRAPRRRARWGFSGPAATLALFVAMALLAPWIAPYDPLAMAEGLELAPPSAVHWLGTDEFGRDVLSRVIHGARLSLAVGFGGMLMAAVAGTLLGLTSGYAGLGSAVDTGVMRIMDTIMAFPGILIGVVLIAILGSGASNVAIAVGIANIPIFTRLVRAVILREREQEYVEAARAMGARSERILFRHLLPNSASAILVQAATGLSAAILLEAGLSFLGLGAQPPDPAWGTMLRDARPFMRQAPWLSIAPGAALTLLVISANFLADRLQVTLQRRR